MLGDPPKMLPCCGAAIVGAEKLVSKAVVFKVDRWDEVQLLLKCLAWTYLRLTIIVPCNLLRREVEICEIWSRKHGVKLEVMFVKELTNIDIGMIGWTGYPERIGDRRGG